MTGLGMDGKANAGYQAEEIGKVKMDKQKKTTPNEESIGKLLVDDGMDGWLMF
jgi:hypothetical protein